MRVANQEQADAWNGDNGLRWVADADRRDRVLQPVGDALIAAAKLRAGEDVLDIGCGCGSTTLTAARVVAPGAVAGIDLSEPMLAVARRRTGPLDNVTFAQADAQVHDFDDARFDVALSRFGTMFFDDQVAAFTNVASTMRAGGRLCIATWQPLAANDWLIVPGAPLLHFAALPDAPADAPGMFAQSDPALVEGVLRVAGWRDVVLDAVTVTLRLGATAAEAAEYLVDSGPGRAMLQRIDDADRPRAIDAVIDTLEPYVRSDGVLLSGGIYLIKAHV